MSEKFVVGYDGSETAQRALDFAVERAKAQQADLLLVHVLEWSPYSFLSAEELQERHKRRREEMDRAEAAVITPVVKRLASEGVRVSPFLRYGKIPEILCDIAREEGALQIFIGREGHSALGARIFGSVAGALVQTTPVPCTIVP